MRARRTLLLVCSDERQASLMRLPLEVGCRFTVFHAETADALWAEIDTFVAPIVLLDWPHRHLVEGVRQRSAEAKVIVFGVREVEAIDSTADWCVLAGERFTARLLEAATTLMVRKRGPKRAAPVTRRVAEVA